MTLIDNPSRQDIADALVERGALLLDAQRPAWLATIVRPVNIAAPDDCILGQVFESERGPAPAESPNNFCNCSSCTGRPSGYATGLAKLGISSSDARHYGFDHLNNYGLADADLPRRWDLGLAWENLLDARRATADAPVQA